MKCEECGAELREIWSVELGDMSKIKDDGGRMMACPNEDCDLYVEGS